MVQRTIAGAQLGKHRSLTTGVPGALDSTLPAMPNREQNQSNVSLNDIQFKWVLADPSSERAVDPLGMGVQADKLAAFLLPDLSVATTRARYFSFLCWAVHKSKGAPQIIHRLEAELAVEEAFGHKGNDVECPGIVGRTRAASYLNEHNGEFPPRPERLYKNTAFAAYRPAMRGLGLLTQNRTPELTTAGRQLASEFECYRGRKPRCLGDISTREQTSLKSLLGLDYRRAELSVACLRRRATFEEVGRKLVHGSASVLERYAAIARRPSDAATILHHAFVWELLWSGLALAFSMVLKERKLRPIARSLREALDQKPNRLPLGRLSADDEECARHVVSLLRTARRLVRATTLETWPQRLAEHLLIDRNPGEFLRQLVQRHRMAKADAPWIALSGDKVQDLVPSKTTGFDVVPRTYRLDAFGQLLRDLGMIQ
jgi:hypothetical protein